MAPDGVFDLSSRREVIGFEQPYENHNGGDLLFGPDGHLYIFSGDGGFVADPQRRALDLGSPHGKILRIDPSAHGDEQYSSPFDNPFVEVDGALDEIWSYGLRNPWRASFDTATGDLWIGDVGDFERESINVAWADEGAGRGMSFGWSAYEGSLRVNEDQPALSDRTRPDRSHGPDFDDPSSTVMLVASDPASTAADLSAIADTVARTRERVAHLAEPYLGTEREDIVTTIYEAERQLLGAERALQRALKVLER